MVEFCAALCRVLTSCCAGRSIGCAFFFSFRQRFVFDQETLAFVALARTAPLKDDRAKAGVFASATSEGSVT
jgi:hypothetical protein